MDNGFSEYRNKLGLRPLGAHKVSWIARKHGYEAITISKLQLLSEDEIFELCSGFVGKNTIIGVSTTFISSPDPSGGSRQKNADHKKFISFIDVIKKLSSKFSNTILIGGAQASQFSEYFDNGVTIKGYAENEIVKFLDSKFRLGIQKKPYDWDIKNCTFEWESQDFVQPNEVLTLETGRGCIFSCKFCGWEEIGKKKGTFETNLQNIKKQIESNYYKYGVTHYLLADDTFNDDDERMNEWCDMLETLPFSIKYSGFMRLDLMSRFKATTKRLYNTGLRGCHFGIESFHPIASKSIGKSFNGKKGKEFLKELYFDIFEQNVAITTTNIVGLPGESKEHILESAKWYSENSYIHGVWSPLALSKNLDIYIKPSEFALYPEKYGYSFLEGTDSEWHNGIMSASEAAALSGNIMSNTDFNDSIDSWCGMLHFSYSGQEPNKYLGTRNFDLRNENMEKINQSNMTYFDSIRATILKKE